VKPVRYRSINATQVYRCRGTYQQTVTGLLNMQQLGGSVYNAASGLSGALNTSTPESGNILSRVSGFSFGFVQLTTRQSTAALVGGIGVRIQNDLWQAGTWVDATTTYTRQTAFQTSTSAQAVEVVGTANNGFVVLCSVPFNLISVNVTTAETGTAPVHDWAYTSPAGWTTTAVTNLTVDDFAATLVTAGEAVVMWDPPGDWVQSGSTQAAAAGYGTGIPNGYYGIRIRATTPPGTTAAVVTGMDIGLMAIQSAGPTGGLQAATANSSALYSPVLSSAETQIPYGDCIIGVFSQQTGQLPTAANSFGNSYDVSFRVGVD
jgi:hypothetical protein